MPQQVRGDLDSTAFGNAIKDAIDRSRLKRPSVAPNKDIVSFLICASDQQSAFGLDVIIDFQKRAGGEIDQSFLASFADDDEGGFRSQQVKAATLRQIPGL